MAYIANWRGDAAQTEFFLSKLQSDDPRIHNPQALPLFLVSEMPDKRSRIIEPRMRSLGVRYFESV